jgi:glycosyltransferase involved in cell wall biosynthesis
MPEVSIIMPVYNAMNYVRVAIDSVLSQSFDDYEFIIIDDGSTDLTNDILLEYKRHDPKLKIIHNKENIGVVKSLNIGLSNSQGNYIARIDADDIWCPGKLLKQIQHFESDNDLYLSATAKRNINADGSLRENDSYPQYFNYNDIRKNILKRNIFCHSSIVFRREVVDILGMYNESYINSEDYEYWIRIISAFKVEMLSEPLVFYRISNSTISFNRLKEQRRYAMKAKISGIRLMSSSVLNYAYLLEDLLYQFIPDFVYKMRK